MTRTHRFICLSLAAAVLGCGGCAASFHDVEAFLRKPRPLVTATEYRLAPPDEVLITSKEVQELDGRVEIIRPDGKIALPLLGTVMVAGRTPEEVAAELEDKAKEFYKTKPDITVRVIEFASKKVYVFGEVSQGGPIVYTGTNTVLGTLAAAQPTRYADLRKIRIVRAADDPDNRHLMTIDLKEMAFLGDSALDAVLEEGDIIYVPPNPFAAVGFALQQVLLPIQPAAATLSTPLRFNATFRTLPGAR